MMKSLLVALATALLVSSAQAQLSCADAHLDGLSRISAPGVLDTKTPAALPEAQKEKLKDLFSKHGLPQDIQHPARALNWLFKKLNQGLTPENSLQRADEMAVFGKEVMNQLSSLPREQRRPIEYALVEAVSKLESFRPEEMIQDNNVVFNRQPDFNYFKPTDFTRVTKAYINKDPFYTQLQNHTGIINWYDIRDIFSNNTWIVELKDHDTYHLFYSTGHPYYLTTIFRMAWSRNATRYYLVSSLFEGIDNFQVVLERAIADHMRAKPEFMVDGKFDLEGAILYLARAPESEIAEIGSKLIPPTDGFYQGFKTWRPKLIGNGKSQALRDQEINHYIREISNFVKDPTNQPYTIYKHYSLQLL